MSLKSMHEEQRSNENSKELTDLQQKLQNALSLVQELQSTNQVLQSANQALQSKNQELQKELQSKSETIVQLNARIAKLNESDLLLKKSEEQLQKSQEEKCAAETISQAANKKAQETEKARQLLQADRNMFEKEKTNFKARVKSEVDAQVAEHRKKLDKAHIARESLWHGVWFGALIYAAILTLFDCLQSQAFRNDFKAFFVAIWTAICFVGEKLISGAKFLANLTQGIPTETAAAIVWWVVVVLVVALAVIVVCGGLLWLFAFLATQYYEKVADGIALWVFLVSVTLVVSWADAIRSVADVNLLLLIIIVHAAYAAIRGLAFPLDN